MTVYGRIFLAGLGSLALLLGALGLQFFSGLAPCPMCIWQRWPHLLAALVAVLAVTVLWRHRRALSVAGLGIMAVSAGLGLFHAGVEQGWWTGLDSCTAPSAAGRSAEELLADIMAAPVVRCDEIPWSLLGLSMAAWNAVASLGLAALWAASVWWWQMPEPGARRA